MPKNYLLIYSEQLATDIELLCQNIKAPSNTLFQIRKSSSSVYANIREANYGQSKADMVAKFEIALKECSETEGWLKLLFNTNAMEEETFKDYRNLCGRIRRMLVASCKTLKENIHTQTMINIDDEEKTVYYTPVEGFTTADLGYENNHSKLVGIMKTDIPEQSKSFISAFDNLWNNEKHLEDITNTVVDYISSCYKENSPEFIYFIILHFLC